MSGIQMAAGVTTFLAVAGRLGVEVCRNTAFNTSKWWHFWRGLYVICAPTAAALIVVGITA